MAAMNTASCAAMDKMTFDALRRAAEDAEVAAVLATIPMPTTLALEPLSDKPYPPQSRVTLNATDAL